MPHRKESAQGATKQHKPPSARWSGGIALVVAGATVAGGGLVLWRAWATAGSSHGDFWAIASPGVATGVGTILLALTTVWVSDRERRAATWERQQAAIERETGAEEASLVEARKVFPILVRDGSTDLVKVVNAGQNPIVSVCVVSARTATPDGEGKIYEWEPEINKDENGDLRGQIPEAPFVLAGMGTEFAGNTRSSDTADKSIAPVDLRDIGETYGTMCRCPGQMG